MTKFIRSQLAVTWARHDIAQTYTIVAILTQEIKHLPDLERAEVTVLMIRRSEFVFAKIFEQATHYIELDILDTFKLIVTVV